MKEVDGILVAAHELKSPLAVLRQLAFSFDDMTPENEHIRHQMITVSERAIRTVNDLAKIRRLEDGLFTMEPVAVRAVCDDITREIQHLFHEQSKSIHVKYKNRSRLAYANRELLGSIIYNFLTNAIRYSDEHSASELTVGDTGSKIQISIRDFGPALPTAIWKELNASGITHPTTISMRPGSTGLGLYIASKFANYMHADVGAIRHRDGTSFYINLPISRQATLWEMS